MNEHLAMVSIKKQDWCEPYELHKALLEGTIFPSLNLPFYMADDTNELINDSALKSAPADEREQLMCKLSDVSFAINDLTLYLDTHPDCVEGNTLFQRLLSERLDLLAKYAHKFYPLTQSSIVTGNCDHNSYEWPDGPIPFEGGLI